MRQIVIAIVAAATALAGLGSTPSPVAAEHSSAPTGPTRDVAQRLSNGANNTCIVLDNEQVRCWGVSAATGVPGSGNVGDDETPDSVRTVDVGAGRTVEEVGVGNGFACVVLDNGDVRCWGYQTFGPTLGVPESNGARIGDDEEPTSIPTTDLGGRATALATGSIASCAILENGSVQCWGDNRFGQLGLGDENDVGDDETPAEAGPVDLGSGNTATAIAAGRYHFCAILQTGDVRCWGIEDSMPGQPEDIGDDEAPSAFPVADLGGEKAVAISAGSSSTCVLTDAGNVWCWGVGDTPRYSTGENRTLVEPEKMELGAVVPVSITLGFSHACIVSDVGELYCWGEGDDGRLGYGDTDDIGDGTIADPESPLSGGVVNVGAGRTVLTASAGTTSTCAVLDNLTVRCWGQGGIIGTGTTANVGDDEVPGDVPVINYTGSAAYIPLSPARLADTRPGLTAPAGSPKGIVAPGATIDVQVTGEGGIPDTGVYAVVLNVAMANPTGFGFVTAYPTGSSRPTAANLNVQDGNASNSVIVPVGDDGKVSLYTSGGGHLVVDTFGYFEQTGSSTSGRQIGITPSRIFDTRPNTPQPGTKGKIAAGDTLEVQVTDTNGVPATGVTAVILNVTAVQANGPGFVTVFPGDEPQPGTANINVSTRTLTRPNTVIMPVSDTGTIKLFTSSGAFLVADVFGYFTDDTADDTDDGLFVPLFPTRLLDSRETVGSIPADGTIDFAVTGEIGIPDTANAAVFNLAAARGERGYVTGYPSDQTQPDTASLNVPDPTTNISNLAILPLTQPSGRITLYSESGAQLIADTSGYFI
jgi:alpha-tubulin suppressor-like RCC1 family protein